MGPQPGTRHDKSRHGKSRGVGFFVCPGLSGQHRRAKGRQVARIRRLTPRTGEWGGAVVKASYSARPGIIAQLPGHAVLWPSGTLRW